MQNFGRTCDPSCHSCLSTSRAFPWRFQGVLQACEQPHITCQPWGTTRDPLQISHSSRTIVTIVLILLPVFLLLLPPPLPLPSPPQERPSATTTVRFYPQRRRRRRHRQRALFSPRSLGRELEGPIGTCYPSSYSSSDYALQCCGSGEGDWVRDFDRSAHTFDETSKRAEGLMIPFHSPAHKR